jgi:tetratricopeptide (TPR) repeat protein
MRPFFYNSILLLIFSLISSVGYFSRASSECTEYLTSADKVLNFAGVEKDVKALMGKAKAYYTEGNLYVAHEILKNIIKQRPDDYRAMGFLAQVYFRMGSLTAALENQIKAKELEPEYRITTDLGIAQILVGLKRFVEADVYLKRVQNKEPKNSLAYGLYARLYLDKNEPDNAAAYISRKLNLDPKDVNGLLYLAEYYFKKGLFNDALEIAYNLLGISPLDDIKTFRLSKKQIMGLALRAKVLSQFSHNKKDLELALSDTKLLQYLFPFPPVWLLYLRAEIEDKLEKPRNLKRTLNQIVIDHKPDHMMALAGLIHLEKQGHILTDNSLVADAVKKLRHDEVVYLAEWSKNFFWPNKASENSPKYAFTFSMDFWNGIHLVPLKY